MTLPSGTFLKQKRNKQSNHELQKNLDSNCISFCTSSRKRQLKTSEYDKKTLSASVNSKLGYLKDSDAAAHSVDTGIS